MKLIAGIAVLSLALTNAAAAQNVLMINNGNRPAVTTDKPQTVSVTFQLTLPAPTSSTSADMTKAMAATSQSLYDIINRECDVLTAVMKGDCHLSRLTIGGNYNETNYVPVPFGSRPSNSPVVNANATATFEISTPAPATANIQGTPAAPPK